MEYEELEQCVKLESGTKSVKLLKKGNKCTLAEISDIDYLKLALDEWVRQHEHFNDEDYKEVVINILEKDNEMNIDTSPKKTFMTPNNNFWADSRILTEEILTSYGGKENGEEANWGKIYDEDNILKYWGQIRSNMANGYGKLLFPTGVPEYEGTFKDNFINGRGLFYCAAGNLIYQGEFKDGVKKGHGVEYYHTGNKMYEGHWLTDQWHGQGVWYDILGDVIFKGQFELGKPRRLDNAGKYGDNFPKKQEVERIRLKNYKTPGGTLYK